MSPSGSLRWLCVARLLASLLCLASVAVPAHELESNRLTLVQREPQHVALEFYVDYVGLLGRTLAPTASRAEFAALCAAMPDARLQRQLAAAHAMFEKDIDIRAVSGERVRVGPLRWPEFREAQRLLREAAMQAIVDPSTHRHASPVEITGDALAATPVSRLRVTLPRTLGSIVVISYRPTQRQVAAALGQAFEVSY